MANTYQMFATSQAPRCQLIGRYCTLSTGPPPRGHGLSAPRQRGCGELLARHLPKASRLRRSPQRPERFRSRKMPARDRTTLGIVLSRHRRLQRRIVPPAPARARYRPSGLKFDGGRCPRPRITVEPAPKRPSKARSHPLQRQQQICHQAKKGWAGCVPKRAGILCRPYDPRAGQVDRILG